MTNSKLMFKMAASALCFASLAACSSDLEDDNSAVASRTIRFKGTVENLVVSRAGSALQADALDKNTEVGLFVATGSDSYTAIENGGNNKLTVGDAGALTPADEMKWGKDALSFFAYAPYSSTLSLSSATYDFTVQDDQSADANYLKSDLMFGVPGKSDDSNYKNPIAAPTGTTADAVTLSFAHKLSKVIITLTKEDNASIDLSSAKLSLVDVKKSVSMNLTTGALTEVDGTGEVILSDGETTSSATNNTYAGIVVPQTIAANTNFIKVESGDNTYFCSLDADQTLAEGEVYSLSVKFLQEEFPTVTLTSVTKDWTEGTVSGNVSSPKKQIVYGVGDYLMKDGTLAKKGEAKSADVIGVIFSTEVSANDNDYTAYILSTTAISSAAPATTSSASSLTFASSYTNPTSLTEEAAELDGLAHTTYVKGLSDISTNYPLFDLSNVGLSTTLGSDNFSDWFIPSIGQMFQIIKNLGGMEIPASTSYQFYVTIPELTTLNEGDAVSAQGKNYYFGKSTYDESSSTYDKEISVLLANLKKATNNVEIFKSGNMYAASSFVTNGSNNEICLFALGGSSFLGTTINNSAITLAVTEQTDSNYDYRTKAWGIGCGSTTSSRARVACIATKLPLTVIAE